MKTIKMFMEYWTIKSFGFILFRLLEGFRPPLSKNVHEISLCTKLTMRKYMVYPCHVACFVISK